MDMVFNLTQAQMIFLGAIGLYALVLVWIGVQSSRGLSHDGFVIGSRKVGLIPTMGSLAASFRDGVGAVLWVGAGFTLGYGGLWLIFGAMTGLFILMVLGPKVRALAAKHDYITIGDAMKKDAGPWTEKIVALVVLWKSPLLIAMQLFVIGNLMAAIFGIEPAYAIFATAAVIAAYLIFGGYNAVVRTDAFQFFLIVGLVIAPFFMAPKMEDMLNVSSLFSMSLINQIGFYLVGIFYILSGAETWQRLFSAKDDKVVRWGFPMSGVFLLFMTITMIIVGFAAKQILAPEIAHDEALFALIGSTGLVSPYLLAFIAVIVLAISMSTLDTEVYSFTSTMARNLLPKSWSKTRDQYVRLSQIMIVVLLLAMSFVSLYISSIISFLFDTTALGYIMVPVFILSALGLLKQSAVLDKALAVCVIVSGALHLYLFFTDQFVNYMWNIVPGTLSLVLCTVTYLFLAPKGKKKKKK